MKPSRGQERPGRRRPGWVGLDQSTRHGREFHACDDPSTVANFRLDHGHPVSRGGGWGLANLRVLGVACNAARGPLSEQEWRERLAAMAEWPERVRRNTLSRLKAGHRVRLQWEEKA